MYKAYDDVTRKQIKDGIVGTAPEEAEGKERYIPHKPVIKETAETTKLRILYDASARQTTSLLHTTNVSKLGHRFRERS